MVIYYIYKSAAIQPVVWPEKFFRFPGSFMFVGKIIYYTVQGDSLLNPDGIIKFLFSLYKIADKVAHQYFRVIEGKICMGEVVNRIIILKSLQDSPVTDSKKRGK